MVRVELGIAKLLGPFAIAITAFPARVKEWAYFGFGISFSSAILARYRAGDAVFNLVAPFVMLLILVASYLSFHRSNASMAN